LLEERTDPAAHELAFGWGDEHLEREHADGGRLEPDAALGRRLLRNLEQLALHDNEFVPGFQPPDRLEPELAVFAAADAEFRDRSDPAAGCQQQEGARAVGHSIE